MGKTWAPITPVKFKPTFLYENPRALISVNGQTFPINEYTLTWNAHGVLDTEEFTIPQAGNPDFTTFLFQNETDTSPIPMLVYAGFPSAPGPASLSQLTKRFIGQT